MPRTVLFLCTGNYYRSRFAEELFNALAVEAGLDWTATSRGLGLDTDKESENVGPISRYAVSGLEARGIQLGADIRNPLQACNQDFQDCDHVVCLKETEHRPMLSRLFPEQCERVEYWNVHDLDVLPANLALRELETEVRCLIARLREA